MEISATSTGLSKLSGNISCKFLFQGNSADYEKAVKATKEAWQIWAEVRVALPLFTKGLNFAIYKKKRIIMMKPFRVKGKLLKIRCPVFLQLKT